VVISQLGEYFLLTVKVKSQKEKPLTKGQRQNQKGKR
jgi:hypothetical protein